MTALVTADGRWQAKVDRATAMQARWELEDSGLADVIDLRDASRYAAEPCAPACEPLATPQAEVRS